MRNWTITDQHGRELTRLPAEDETEAATTARRIFPGVAELERFDVHPAQGEPVGAQRVTDAEARLALNTLAGKLRGPRDHMHVDAALLLGVPRRVLERLERGGFITWHHMLGANPAWSSLLRISLTPAGLRAAFCAHPDVCHSRTRVEPPTRTRPAIAVDTPYCARHSRACAHEHGPRGD